MPSSISLLISVLLATLVTTTVNAQQLRSYVERPADAAGVFAIWPGSGVPTGSEKWNWHEQTVQVPGSVPSQRPGLSAMAWYRQLFRRFSESRARAMELPARRRAFGRPYL